VLFIDARKLGHLVDRTRRELSNEEIVRIGGTYHAWRGEAGEYADVPGFCEVANIGKIQSHSYVLTPGRYVGAADIEDDALPFEERFAILNDKLQAQFYSSHESERQITEALRRIGDG
jgi:type I restriction enzyme M protein